MSTEIGERRKHNVIGDVRYMKKEDIRRRLQQLNSICQEYNLKNLSERIDSQLKLIDEPLRIMIVGEGKSGKSSLLNALVGATVAEVDYEPKTWCIGVYESTKGEPYAEVVYQDNIVRTTVEEAKKLMEEYEENSESKDSIDEIVKSREIEEIRWHLNINWPNDGMVIIDTPGFLQGRADTEIIETQIDGAEGVRFVASDGFEKYYSKSDLVLWCFEATDVGAADVKEKLESVKTQDKSIYGIVTKLDKCDSDSEREEFFQRNNSHYKKYIKQCLRSQLPPIRKKDSGDKLQKKLQLRQDTVDGIKRCIEYLLNDNEAADIKLKSYETFCTNIEKLLAVYLGKYVNFYYSNLQVYSQVKDKVNKDITSLRNSSINKICQILLDKENSFLVGTEYDALWYQCDEQPQNFASVLKAQEKNSGLMETCNSIQRTFSEDIQKTVLYHGNDMKWNVINIGSIDNDSTTAEFKFNLTERNIYFNELVINIQNSFWDDLLNLFDKNGVVYSVINGLFGNMRKERTFSKIRDAFVSEIGSVRKQYLDQINDNYQHCINDFENTLEDLFYRINGINSGEVDTSILRIDEVMSSMHLYPDNSPYIPYLKDNRLCFARNELLLKIESFQEKTQSENIVDYIKINYIQKAFTLRLNNDEEIIQNAMLSYNGVKGIQIKFDTPDFYHDKYIFSFHECWDKIRWGKNENKIKEAYKNELKQYLIAREELWIDYSQKAVERVLSTCMKEWDKVWIEPIKQFIERWRRQCDNSFRQCKLYKNYVMTPPEWDVKKYYQYDQMYNANYANYFFMQYISDGTINPSMFPNVSIVTPDGENASTEVKKHIEKNLSTYKAVINSIQMKNSELWDKEVQFEVNQIMESLSNSFDEIQRLVEEVIFPDYLKYLVALKGSKHRKNITEYIVTCGKLSKSNSELMCGNIPMRLYGNTINFMFSNGTRINDDVRKYIKSRSEEISNIVKEKMSNGR